MAAESLWQQLFNAVKFRMQEIRTASGYQTDIGSKCFSWRDLSASPFKPEDVPCVMLRDPRRETTIGGDWAKLGKHQHNLQIEVLAFGCPVNSEAPDAFARMIAVDLERAIGTDRFWTVNGTRLARETIPGSDELEVSHKGDRLVGVRKTFTIVFVTNLFDPYTQ